jgi:radical SAM superfamily enzyme YgiQ (UPF0313 family)
MIHIDPVRTFSRTFLSVNNPARYIGGEYGAVIKGDAESSLTFVIAFPDLYELAMSNQAIKIIYNALNRMPGIRCERVFCPDVDFEALLQTEGIPLYTLETGIPLFETDVIGFSLGYELGLTNVFTMLERGGVPVLKADRNSHSPLVIAGGCGVTNPAPYAAFFDAIFIGEAEDELFNLVQGMAHAKNTGAGRDDIFGILATHPAVWMDGKTARRAVWAGFGREPSIAAYLPLASIKPVQGHGVSEIMRGCPNGCRFCHAAMYYRPQRIKPPVMIFDEVETLVTKAGCNAISLTSLSSADYPGLEDLLDGLNRKWMSKNISFQLPSLKVNSLTLPVLEKISRTRKSSLTFAIETPEESWQLALNKEVYTRHLTDIIREAKQKGWSGAKFYFMIGLPPAMNAGSETYLPEEELIVDFMLNLQRETRIQCSVSVGVFIPKPHTPFQWCAQISPEEAEKKFAYIRHSLPRGKFKVSTQSGFYSYLEGLISRGDQRVGMLFFQAWQRGCRFDAWDDHARKNLPIWQEMLEQFLGISEILTARDIRTSLPWDTVTLGAGKDFLIREYEQSLAQRLSPPCTPDCKRCGLCGTQGSDGIVQVSGVPHPPGDIEGLQKSSEVVDKSILSNHILKKNSEVVLKSTQFLDKTVLNTRQLQNIPVLWRCVFQFSKKDGAQYIPHLSIQEIFQKVFIIGGLPVQWTQGFNPLPRLEFVGNLPVGVESEAEIASCILDRHMAGDEFQRRFNGALPRGFLVTRVFIFPVSNKRKRESLASLRGMSEYGVEFFTAGDGEVFFDNPKVQVFFPQSGGSERMPVLRDGFFHVVLSPEKERPFRELFAEIFGEPFYRRARLKKIAAFTITGESYFTRCLEIAEINRTLIRGEGFIPRPLLIRGEN